MITYTAMGICMALQCEGWWDVAVSLWVREGASEQASKCVCVCVHYFNYSLFLFVLDNELVSH